MSYQLQRPGVVDTSGIEPPKKGSVRAARERLLAAQTQSASTPELSSSRQPLASQYTSQEPWSSQPQLTGLRPDVGNPSVLSPVSPGQQWPLPVDSPDDAARAGKSPRGPPPQRPPRPSYVPAILSQPQNNSPQQLLRPSLDSQDWTDDDYASYSSPNLSRPITTSSRGSTTSSLGSIPDFPVPQSQPSPLPRRPPTLGPPPSARRGPSSYYSQMSYVSPIAEESESRRESRRSFASSNVIPSGIPESYYLTEGETPSDDEGPPFEEDGRSSRNTDHEETTLVRSASVGKRSKPTLTTIKSGDNLKGDKTPPSRKITPPAIMIPGAAGFGTSQDVFGQPEQKRDLSGGTGLLDSSSEASSPARSEKDFEKDLTREKSPTETHRSHTPLVTSPMDPRVDQILGGLQRGGSIDQGTADNLKQSSLAERVGTRRPPRLNVDAVREAETRGSLTSLPDLIRRATRLAANLDRGRTASRLGMDWLVNDGSGRRDAPEDQRKSENSLSDILASFPPPGLATPTSDRAQSPRGRYGKQQQSNRSRLADYEVSALPEGASGDFKEAEPEKQGRRCCGMPRWAFLLLLLVLFLLIAAAVVVPVVLIVLPRQRENNDRDAASSALAACQSSLKCLNGGTSIVNTNGSCGCVCANGFTGTTCASANLAGCTTIDVSGANNATVGSDVARLLKGATSNFSIPLDASRLLALFAATDMTCSSENALVTFNGLSSRSAPLLQVRAEPRIRARDDTVTTAAPTPTETVANDNGGVAVTSNGIVYAATPTSTISVTLVGLSSTRTSTAPTTTATASASTDRLVDFVKVGVLFVFQESRSLDRAASAQSTLQNVLNGRSGSVATARNVTLTGGFSMNLVDLTVTLSNGTVYGR